MKRKTAKALGIGAALALLGAAAAFSGWKRLDDARRAEIRLQSEWRALVAERAGDQEAAETRREQEERWDALRARGFFESPAHSPRLVWVRQLRQLQAERNIPSIEARWRLPESVSAGETNFRCREGTLEMELNHELELPALLDALREKTPALIRVRECGMRPNPGRQGEARRGPNLRVWCALEWTTGILTELGAEATR